MAYTTPATSTAGTVLQAAFLNTYVRDNVSWMATDSPCCRAYNNAALSLSTGVATAFTLNSERFDNAAIHSTSVNTSRMTVPTGAAGKYVFGGVVGWALSGAGTQRQSKFEINGSNDVGIDTRTPSASHGSESCPTTSYVLSVADYVELLGKQDSGGALNASNGFSSGPEFWIYWLRT